MDVAAEGMLLLNTKLIMAKWHAATIEPKTVILLCGNHSAASNKTIPSNIPNMASLFIHNNNAQDFSSSARQRQAANLPEAVILYEHITG